MNFILLSLTALAFVASCGLAAVSWFAAAQMQAELGLQALDCLHKPDA
ncbi:MULTISPECIES: hypothetical protein [Roseateles]|uniref:Uncharacterized protein n=1 Tax=Roseateles albus TaxID=2987525 RepID=A0ABT5KHH6_9BURK|nr:MULTISPECIES: hypothetical protein [Roseateles]MCV2360605.1 hypothetical protein [Paucibacter sp. TC2R-5]MDC8773362.1 hypothetical protein [Roseateles albus]